MSLPENDYQILRLSDAFYQDYPNSSYKEIKKQKRAYNCLLFQTHYNYFICIPYRTEITHDNAYHFKNTKRSKEHKSGLDYSKILIISNSQYLDDSPVFVDNDEYRETLLHFEKIKRDALKYVEDYIGHLNKSKELHPSEFRRRYQFSCLKYFHKELHI